MNSKVGFRTALSLTLFITLAFTSLYAWGMREELRIARDRIRELEETRSALLPRADDLPARPTDRREAASEMAAESATTFDGATLSSPPSSRPPQADDAGALHERAVAWRVQWQSGEVERSLALSEEERARLREGLAERFRQELAGGTGDAREFDEAEVVAEVLGADVAERYRAARIEREERRVANEIEEETALLTRRLTLDPATEHQVRSALENAYRASEPVRDEIRTRMRSAMRSHSGASTDQAALQARYDEIRALADQARDIRREALISELQGKLSDDQLNELLSYQATRHE